MARRRKSTIPQYKRRRARSWPRRIFGWIVKLSVAFFAIAILWVLAYRIVPPPITATMLGDVFTGRALHKDWMPISEIDRDMVRAAIAAEDSKFCQHNGFDFEAIEDAMKRNASGGRIPRGTTHTRPAAQTTLPLLGGGGARQRDEGFVTFLLQHALGQ